MKKIKAIDLFAGCGGLLDGFEQSQHYETIATVEWELAPCKNLKTRLINKWNYLDADRRVLRFDIQRTEELFTGWNDETYGHSEGLDRLISEKKGLDIIIGGPPCQAYSIAGRAQDENNMKDDYRNFLFESYLAVVRRYQPKVFVFENVPGILSANPTGIPIIELIQKKISDAGYSLLPSLNKAIIDFTEYGVPQNRKRIIIFGVNTKYFGEATAKKIVIDFYNKYLPKYKVVKKTNVRDAIGDLPKLYPLKEDQKYEGKKISYTFSKPFVANHVARWQSERDRKVFKLLTEDIERKDFKYISSDALKQLYTEVTGKHSNVHKYHVIQWDTQSNLIPAHLYKDGLRHIHPDSKQSRTITIREAARLQSFPDDYIFEGSNVELFKMIGNAVPPRFAKCLGEAINNIYIDYQEA